MVLVYGSDTIARIVSYAEDPAHWYRPGPGVPPPGVVAGHVAMLGYVRAVFSITVVGPSEELFRHLSLSVPDRCPAPGATIVQCIAHEFGFYGPLCEFDTVEIVADAGEDPGVLVLAQRWRR